MPLITAFPQISALHALQASFQLEARLHALHARRAVLLAPVLPQQPAVLAPLIMAIILELILALLA